MRGEHRGARCEACGTGGEAGRLLACPGCGEPLHEDCLRFAGCPRCPEGTDGFDGSGRAPTPSARAPSDPAPATRAEVLRSLRGRRLAATMLDAGVLLVPALAVLAVGLFGLGLGPLGLLLASVGAAVAVDLVNVGLFLGEGGATLGKRLMGLRVVDQVGRHLGWRRALSREFLFKTVSTLTLGAGFVGVMGKEARAWHDQASGTRVLLDGAPEALQLGS